MLERVARRRGEGDWEELGGKAGRCSKPAPRTAPPKCVFIVAPETNSASARTRVGSIGGGGEEEEEEEDEGEKEEEDVCEAVVMGEGV